MTLAVFQVLFLGLKLSGMVTWSWFWVLSPAWLWILATLILVVLKVTEK